MLNRIKLILDLFPTGLTPAQHCRNLALIGTALLIVIGLIAGWSVVFAMLSALSGGFAALLAFDWLGSQPAGDSRLRQASEKICRGAVLFLMNLYKSIALLSVLLGILIGTVVSWSAAIGFILGVLTSEFIGYVGFVLTMRTRSTVLQATHRNLLAVTQLALSSGVISGLLVSGTALTGLGLFYTVLVASQTAQMVVILAGLAAGAALVAMLVSMSSIVFVQTSLASGADAAMQSHQTQPQPTNMIKTIAEHVGERSGLITDCFATIITALVAAIIINRELTMMNQLITYPLVIIAVSILSVIVVLQVLQQLNASLKPALLIRRILLSSAMLNAIVLMPVSIWMFDASELYDQAGISINQLYLAVLIGLFLAVLISIASSDPAKSKFAKFFPPFIHQYHSIVVFLIVIIGLLISERTAGLLGIETAIISLLSLNIMTVVVANLSQMMYATQPLITKPEQYAERQQLELNCRALTHRYGLTGSALTALILAIAYYLHASVNTPFSVINLTFMSGLLIGAIAIAWFCALLISVISRVTVNAKPVSSSDYAITALAKQCQRELLFPALAPVLFVMAVTSFFGEAIIHGFMIGSGLTGLLIGFAAMSEDHAWIVIKRWLAIFWPANTPTGWNSSATEHLTSDPYRTALVSVLSPVVKMLSVLALLLAV